MTSSHARRRMGGLAVVGGAVLLWPGSGVRKALRHQLDVLGRRIATWEAGSKALPTG